METIVLDGQSMFDLAVQESGSVETAFALAVLNDISLSSEIPAGRLLLNTPIHSGRIADYYRLKGIRPATYLTSYEKTKLMGIGYMAVDIDFIVS